MTRYISERRGVFGVEPICRVLGASPSSFYARRDRKPSARVVRDRELLAEIGRARDGYRAVYGARKTWKELRRRGVPDAGRGRVERLMRQAGLQGVRRGRAVRTTTPAERAAERARDLVRRDFRAEAPNRLWVSDLTYIRTWQGFAYLAFVLDVHSRRIVGWQLAGHLRTELVLDALEMAGGLRRPVVGALVAHTDRGSQYTSLAYTDRLSELGIAPSVGSVGDALDNAMAESFVATYKSELIDRHGPWRSFEQLEHQTVRWIGFYNHERLHEQLGDVPPVEYERAWAVDGAAVGTASSGAPHADPERLLSPRLGEPSEPRTPLGAPTSRGLCELTTPPTTATTNDLLQHQDRRPIVAR